MKTILQSALNFPASADNTQVIAVISMMVNGKPQTHKVIVEAPSNVDVMRRVWKLNDAGMDIFNVKFL